LQLVIVVVVVVVVVIIINEMFVFHRQIRCDFLGRTPELQKVRKPLHCSLLFEQLHCSLIDPLHSSPLLSYDLWGSAISSVSTFECITLFAGVYLEVETVGVRFGD
jgi:hypothetical protein